MADVEVAWFSALCDDDYEFLGVPDPALASSWEHCRDLVLRAERHGFDNILLPSGYALGIDAVAFAGGVAPLLERLRLLIDDMRARAARHARALRFGYRVHVIVHEREADARAAAARLVSKLDAATGEAIRNQSLDSASAGVRRQAELRGAASDDGFVEEHLWTGIGAARSGCGAAIVGDPDQVLAKLQRYAKLGIEAFILSGYPHAQECDLFARHVLPRLDHSPLGYSKV